jgi:hypothetical protein
MVTQEPPQEYIEVLEVLSTLYEEVDGYSFYNYIFPDNQKRGEFEGNYEKPNAIFLYTDDKDKGTKRRLRRRIMLSDTWKEDYINYVENNSSTLCSGITYRGRANNLENAQRMCALALDLDGVGLYELKNLLLRFGQPAENIRTLPIPTFLVASGTGLHLYYVFQEPIDLFPNIKLQLKSLKYDLTFRMWDYKSTSKKDKVQYQSIVQGFRMVGSINPKYGVEVRAFQIGDRVTLEYLNSYVKPQNRVDVSRRFAPSKMSREQAKESYPEWYQRVVVEKNKRQKKWDIKGKQGFALYNWWLRCAGEITGGHRYYYLMCLVIYACKCDVPKDKLKADMYAVFEKLKLVEHDNPLTKEDVESALEVYSKEYYNFKISDIEYLTDLHIERNKRNYRKQAQHMEIMRAIQNVTNPNWRKGNGRKSVKPIIVEFLYKNPEATKAEVIRGTGLSKPTVYKHYETAKEEAQLMKERTVAEGVDMEKLQVVISKFEKLQEVGRTNRHQLLIGETRECYK